MDWGVNADSTNFDVKIVEFENLLYDGELKYFCFGLHSVDFERNGKWEALRLFAKEYGKRPDDFWYATNSEIFEYDEAIKLVGIEDGKIINPTGKELFVEIADKKYKLSPFSKTEI